MWQIILGSLPTALAVATLVGLGLTEYLCRHASQRDKELFLGRMRTRDHDKSEKSKGEEGWQGRENAYESRHRSESDPKRNLFGKVLDGDMDVHHDSGKQKDSTKEFGTSHKKTPMDRVLPDVDDPSALAPYQHALRQNLLDSLGGLDHRVVMQVLISLAALSVSFYIILSARYDAGSKHWSYGTVGTLFGFWLKGAADSSASRRQQKRRSGPRKLS